MRVKIGVFRHLATVDLKASGSARARTRRFWPKRSIADIEFHQLPCFPSSDRVLDHKREHGRRRSIQLAYLLFSRYARTGNPVCKGLGKGSLVLTSANDRIVTASLQSTRAAPKAIHDHLNDQSTRNLAKACNPETS